MVENWKMYQLVDFFCSLFSRFFTVLAIEYLNITTRAPNAAYHNSRTYCVASKIGNQNRQAYCMVSINIGGESNMK